AAPVVHYAEFTGSVDPGSGAYLIAAIHGAQERGVEALVVRIDTPGGLLTTTRDIVQAELNAKVPIVFWVGPPGARAGSAGVFLTMAAHVAAMAPSTNIGAAHPVALGSPDENKKGEQNTMLQKLEKDSAEVRNVPWAVKDEVLHGLANPEVAYLIAMLGVIGVMLELFHPGTVVPGVVGGICLVIAAIAFQMLPVNVGALLLIVLGIGFFVAEMYIGGHGGFVAAGLVCVVIGSLLLIGPVDKSFYGDADFGLGWRI